MKKDIVYVCSPLATGDFDMNIDMARVYSRYVAEIGSIPITPHLYFTQFLDDRIDREREIGMDMGLEIIEKCDYLYVFGDVISEGMKREIEYASSVGTEVLFVPTDEAVDYLESKGMLSFEDEEVAVEEEQPEEEGEEPELDENPMEEEWVEVFRKQMQDIFGDEVKIVMYHDEGGDEDDDE